MATATKNETGALIELASPAPVGALASSHTMRLRRKSDQKNSTKFTSGFDTMKGFALLKPLMVLPAATALLKMPSARPQARPR